MWKTLTAQIKEIYYLLISRELFSEKQKDCRKRSRKTWQLLSIDQRLLKESKIRHKNLAIVCIDYKNVYDMVPQRWIIDCLKLYKISEEVIKFIEKTMKKRKVELTAGG